MKGVILSGGFGTRLEPLTHTRQKQMLPVANVPVIEHIVDAFVEIGISDIGIVVGGRFPKDIISHFSEYRSSPTVEFIEQGDPKGLAHAVGCAESFVYGDDFLLQFGDTIIDLDILEGLTDTFDSGEYAASIGFQTVDEPNRYGIAKLRDGELAGIMEKPDDPPSNLAYVGAMVLGNEVFDYTASVSPSWRGELELTDVLDEMVKSGEAVEWDTYEGKWRDVGTPNDVIETNSLLLSEMSTSVDGDVGPGVDIRGVIDVGTGTKIRGESVLRGPVAIGKNVEIHDSVIGPGVSVDDRCEIRGSDIKSSVLLGDTTLDGVDSMYDSLIGENCRIESDVPSEFSLVVGDNSDCVFDAE